MTAMARTTRTILITGASSGIGTSLARQLARDGHRLALTARRLDLLESLAVECRGLGAEVLVIAADLADHDEPGRIVGEAVARFGGLDVLINNAGYGLGKRFVDAPTSELVKQIDVNLVAPVLLARHAMPHLVGARGTLINVGSSITAVAVPLFGVYGMTKAGLAYWNDALRREVRRLGVRVCLVEPGPVSTGFIGAIEAQGPAELSPFESRPPAFATATADDAARRIARLIDRPRRRISMLRRAVWPLRAVGALFRAWPALGDLALSPLASRRTGGGR